MRRPRRRWSRLAGRALRLLNPIAWLRSLRESLTAASVTLILVGIVSLNIIWGYPWLGMFAACFALLVVGRTINYFAAPRLIAVVNAARSVPVDRELVIPTRLINRGRWPAMDLILEKTKRCRFVAPAGEILITPAMRFRRRGQHPLPTILVDSYFPFHLFRYRQWIDPKATIVATPKRLVAADDTEWQTLESTLKGIASRTARGDQVHYIGSREYREGVPVRRWDFSSWARLGKPILREFSTPADKSVRIVVDPTRPVSAQPTAKGVSIGRLSLGWPRRTSKLTKASYDTGLDLPFERLLSFAASSIETLIHNGAAVVLEVLAADDADAGSRLFRCEAGGDPSDLLIVLGNASAHYIDDSALLDRKPIEGETNPRGHEATIVMSSHETVEVSLASPRY